MILTNVIKSEHKLIEFIMPADYVASFFGNGQNVITASVLHYAIAKRNCYRDRVRYFIAEMAKARKKEDTYTLNYCIERSTIAKSNARWYNAVIITLFALEN